jgi:hypothetical protein
MREISRQGHLSLVHDSMKSASKLHKLGQIDQLRGNPVACRYHQYQKHEEASVWWGRSSAGQSGLNWFFLLIRWIA